MLQNNLDPDVAERPDDLVVYGGAGRAARSWDAYHAMIRALTNLGGDETLLVQSGKPVGVLRTHEWAPRVLIANSNLVPEWGTWDEFRRLEHLGLTMYGQMTAGSWIYIGTQGILQGTYECFGAIADWPLLNALVNTSSGASWVSIHHGGGVGIGRSIHAGQVSVADGTDLAAQKLERVLLNDPATGVMRHADAGYDRAREVAAERGVRIPSQPAAAQ